MSNCSGSKGIAGKYSGGGPLGYAKGRAYSGAPGAPAVPRSYAAIDRYKTPYAGRLNNQYVSRFTRDFLERYQPRDSQRVARPLEPFVPFIVESDINARDPDSVALPRRQLPFKNPACVEDELEKLKRKYRMLQ